jgi:hypothetical protein
MHHAEIMPCNGWWHESIHYLKSNRLRWISQSISESMHRLSICCGHPRSAAPHRDALQPFTAKKTKKTGRVDHGRGQGRPPA